MPTKLYESKPDSNSILGGADEGQQLVELRLNQGVSHAGLAVLNLDSGGRAECSKDAVPRVECEVGGKD
jgi:hypothetical protein